MEKAIGGGPSIVHRCPTIEWYPHQDSFTCCAEPQMTGNIGNCLMEG